MHLVSFPLKLLDSSIFLPSFTAAIFIPLVRVLSLLTQLCVCSWAGPEFNPATWHRNTDGTCRFRKHFNVILNLEVASMLIRRCTINSIHFKKGCFSCFWPIFFAFLEPRFVTTPAKQQGLNSNVPLVKIQNYKFIIAYLTAFTFTNSNWKSVLYLLKHFSMSFPVAIVIFES